MNPAIIFSLSFPFFLFLLMDFIRKSDEVESEGPCISMLPDNYPLINEKESESEAISYSCPRTAEGTI
jgi:hypothetical protein